MKEVAHDSVKKGLTGASVWLTKHLNLVESAAAALAGLGLSFKVYSEQF